MLEMVGFGEGKGHIYSSLELYQSPGPATDADSWKWLVPERERKCFNNLELHQSPGPVTNADCLKLLVSVPAILNFHNLFAL